MTESSSTVPNAHEAFTAVRRERIDSLNVTVEQYEHRNTAANTRKREHD